VPTWLSQVSLRAGRKRMDSTDARPGVADERDRRCV
jgi:hypothetical protein